jgi:hypothetical protein
MDQSKGEIMCFEIHKLICSLWNKEELPQQRKESIIVPIYKNGDKTDCNIYRGISHSSTAYKILSNIILARLTPYVNKIIGDHLGGFRRNRSTMDQIFQIQQILDKKWEYSGTLHQLFIDIKKPMTQERSSLQYSA